jgi:hypothetical protein
MIVACSEAHCDVPTSMPSGRPQTFRSSGSPGPGGARCLRDARLVLQQLLAGVDPFDTTLPYGYPNRANRPRWYPALYQCVKGWQRMGMTPMESYREVARRNKVDVNG